MQPALQRATLREFFPYLRGHVRVLALVAVVSLVSTGLSIAQPLMVQQLVNAVSASRPATVFVWFLIAITLGGAVFGAAQSYLLQRTAESVVLGVRRSLVGQLLALPVREFDRRRVGDLMSRVGSDTTLMRSVITSGLFEIVSSILMFCAAVVLMVLIDPLLFGITLCAVLLGAAGVLFLGRLIRRRSRDVQDAVGSMTAAVERGLSGIRTIKASVAEEREAAVIDGEATRAFRAGIAMARLQAAVQPIMSICIQGAFIVVLAVGGIRVAAGELLLGDLIAFILYLFLLVMPIGSAMSAFVQIQSGLAALDRIQEIARLEPERADEDRPVRIQPVPAQPDAAFGSAQGAGRLAGRSAGRSAGAIELRDVSFRYDDGGPDGTQATPASGSGALHAGQDRRAPLGSPGVLHTRVSPETEPSSVEPSSTESGRLVLDGVSFSVPAGSRTALVGPSGAGKSTVLALLERFYEPTDGSITYDGTALPQIPRTELRSRIGLVEQEAPVLSGTLADNLRLAAPAATDDQLRRVLAAVGLDALGDRTDDGLDLNLGEDGVRLSGGQRQRLAWARVILADRPVLLMDEPTSAVDSRTEQLLQQTLGEASRDRTVVVVAHRLSTVADFDQIVVLDQGRVTAVGTHEQLLEESDLYRDMASRQRLVAA
ncbi:ABC transporter ATP-binding protein [Arthrobacter burdickii]|uniref:ABC transporter ATP-binding protein n=1 Tax=Arthrobacter burdickii TaxID=3035920 RepID=A0ABT8K5S7_9MICC|nr:ABC transporter ATP-binding protein [Arthrobacter burdickii]MDN4612801.1 ABC transporter ATP-binding protein [Arthrobacter burdickii]